MAFDSIPSQCSAPATECLSESTGVAMKLYYMAGECSQAVHILLREAGLPFEIVAVNPHAQRTDAGEDYLAINPSGLVPALEVKQGVVITGVSTILQYIADLVPHQRLLPRIGEDERYQALSWVSFIATEIHHPFAMLFEYQRTDASSAQTARLSQRIDLIEQTLQARPFLLGDRFTAPDAYLFVVAGWLPFIGLDLGRWPALRSFRQRIYARPAVQGSLEAEGFLLN